MSRLSNSGIKAPANARTLDRIHVAKLAGMDAATAELQAAFWHKGATPTGRDKAFGARLRAELPARMLGGNPATFPAIMAAADALAEAAVQADARLGARPGWVRAVEGVDLCPALLAAGEESCCFNRTRQRQTDAVATGEPVRIVISTDTKNITPAAASAFIAAARLAAQFVPLEIWWQSSWLREAGTAEAGLGHVFLVPLLAAGEMDFSRVQFVLCDRDRDAAAFCVMFNRAYPSGYNWGGVAADYSHLDGTTAFIPASGMTADPASIAAHAARWAGMESLWLADYEASRDRSQTWAPAVEAAPYVYTPPTDEDRARWAKDEADREKVAAVKAKSRLGELF